MGWQQLSSWHGEGKALREVQRELAFRCLKTRSRARTAFSALLQERRTQQLEVAQPPAEGCIFKLMACLNLFLAELSLFPARRPQEERSARSKPMVLVMLGAGRGRLAVTATVCPVPWELPLVPSCPETSVPSSQPTFPPEGRASTKLRACPLPIPAPTAVPRGGHPCPRSPVCPWSPLCAHQAHGAPE